MTEEKLEIYKDLIDQISDINQVAIRYLDSLNSIDVCCLITVLKSERNLLNKLFELNEEEGKE